MRLIHILVFLLSIEMVIGQSSSTDSLQVNFKPNSVRLYKHQDSIIRFNTLAALLSRDFSNDLPKDGRWVYYKDRANMQELKLPVISVIVPEYKIYKIRLTNYLGYHVNESTCVLLFDSLKSKLLLVEPLWYRGTSKDLLKLFIGHSFTTKDSLFNFLTELNELMQVGSVYKYRQTSVTDSCIRYDLCYFNGDSYTTGGNGATSTIRYNEDGVWRKIIIDIDKLTIVRYTEINPKTED